MINLWTEMYRGMGFAAVVVGFLFMLGVTLVILGGIGWSILALLKSDDPDGEVTDDDGDEGGGDLDPYDACYASPDGAHADAHRVGRHLRKGPQ